MKLGKKELQIINHLIDFPNQSFTISEINQFTESSLSNTSKRIQKLKELSLITLSKEGKEKKVQLTKLREPRSEIEYTQIIKELITKNNSFMFGYDLEEIKVNLETKQNSPDIVIYGSNKSVIAIEVKRTISADIIKKFNDEAKNYEKFIIFTIEPFSYFDFNHFTQIENFLLFDWNIVKKNLYIRPELIKKFLLSPEESPEKDNTPKILDKDKIMKVAKEALYICSNPQCHSMTIISSEKDENSLSTNGKIIQIIPNKEEINADSYSDESNFIYLCPNCSSMIENNEYSPELLSKWKLTHENWLNENLNLNFNNTKKKAYYPINEIEFNQKHSKEIIEQGLKNFFNVKNSFFVGEYIIRRSIGYFTIDINRFYEKIGKSGIFYPQSEFSNIFLNHLRNGYPIVHHSLKEFLKSIKIYFEAVKKVLQIIYFFLKNIKKFELSEDNYNYDLKDKIMINPAIYVIFECVNRYRQGRDFDPLIQINKDKNFYILGGGYQVFKTKDEKTLFTLKKYLIEIITSQKLLPEINSLLENEKKMYHNEKILKNYFKELENDVTIGKSILKGYCKYCLFNKKDGTDFQKLIFKILVDSGLKIVHTKNQNSLDFIDVQIGNHIYEFRPFDWPNAFPDQIWKRRIEGSINYIKNGEYKGIIEIMSRPELFPKKEIINRLIKDEEIQFILVKDILLLIEKYKNNS